MNVSIWADDLPVADLSVANDPIPPEADAVVIGAGYTGLNAARELARSGYHVVVFEKKTIGEEASGVNFGSAALGVTASLGSLRAQYGGGLAREVTLLSREVLTEFCELIQREAIDCELRQTSHISVALTQAQWAQMETVKRSWDSAGRADWVLLDDRAAREYLDIDGVRGGLMNPTSYTVNPAKYLAGLYRAAIRAGVRVIERTAVTGVRRAGRERLESTFAARTIRSKHVVVCTDGVRMPGFPPSERGIVPVNSYMIATAPLDDAQLRPVSRAVFSTARMVADYFRVIPGNRLLFGSRKNIAAKPYASRDRAELIARMNALLPFMAGVPVTHSWHGLLGFTADRLPHVGAYDGIHYALGYCGKGIPWSAHCGIAVANLVKGAKAERAISAPLAIPAFDRSHPVFLRPLAWSYRVRDRWNGWMG